MGIGINISSCRTGKIVIWRRKQMEIMPVKIEDAIRLVSGSDCLCENQKHQRNVRYGEWTVE